MLRIGRGGLAADARDVDRLRAEFATSQVVLLRGLLDPHLVHFILGRLEQSEWRVKIHPGIAEEHIAMDKQALHLLHFLSNMRQFRLVIQEITRSEPLSLFYGRVYRMIPALGHYDRWHNDVTTENRVLGMSLNLSPRGYRGGLFQLRQSGPGRILAEIANTGLGDALLFKLSKNLEHRVGDIEGDEPKTAFAGWFKPDVPELFVQLKAAGVRECL